MILRKHIKYAPYAYTSRRVLLRQDSHSIADRFDFGSGGERKEKPFRGHYLFAFRSFVVVCLVESNFGKVLPIMCLNILRRSILFFAVCCLCTGLKKQFQR